MNRQSISSTLREKVTKRDNGICQCCGICSISEIHHITPICYGGTDDINNLVGLCNICHKYAPNSKEEFIEYKKKGGMAIQEALGVAFLNSKLLPHETFKVAMEVINYLRNFVIRKSIEKYGLPLEDIEYIKRKIRGDVRNAKIARNERKILYNFTNSIGKPKEMAESSRTIPCV